MSTVGQRIRAASKAVVGVFSENAARQAYGLLSGIFPGGVGLPPERGTREYLLAFRKMPWLRATAGRIAAKVAATEWELFVQRRKGGKAQRNRVVQRAKGHQRRALLLKQLRDTGDLEQIESHILLDLLHDANEFQAGDAFWKSSQLHLDLVGDAFWLKERDGLGVIIGLWPIPPDWISATPTPANRVFRVQFKGWRGLIPDTEFVWLNDPDPSNPYGRGSGMAMALADELETDEYAAKHTKAFFFNRARPDLMVFPKNGNMRNEDVARFEDDWLNRNQGFWRAFKPYFLSREVGVHEFDQGNLRAQQLVPLRQYERDTVMQVFGMPPEILGVLENANRATITAADLIMNRYVVEPRLEFLRGVLQERIIPEFDDRLIINYVSPVQDDKDFQLDVSKAHPYAFNVAMVRDMAGVSAPEDEDEEAGKLFFIPNTGKLGPLEEAPDPPPPMLPPGTPGAAPGAAPPPGQPKPPAAGRSAFLGQPDDGNDLFRADLKDAAAACRMAGDPVTEAWLLKAAADDLEDLPPPSQAAARFERRLVRDLLHAWDHATEVVDLEALEQALSDGAIESAIRRLGPEVEDEAVRAAVDPVLVDAGLAGAKLARAELVPAAKDPVDVDLEAVNPEVEAWARTHAAALMTATRRTRLRVRQLVTEALAEGTSPAQLARELRTLVGLTDRQAAAVASFRRRLRDDGLGGEKLAARVARYALALRRDRALTIARTETIAATNAGQQALWRHARSRGLIDASTMKRVWIVTHDERLESTCEALGEHDPVDLEEPWPGGHMHPPAHPRCRCAVGLVRVAAR